jgi:hypothetical protein
MIRSFETILSAKKSKGNPNKPKAYSLSDLKDKINKSFTGFGLNSDMIREAFEEFHNDITISEQSNPSFKLFIIHIENEKSLLIKTTKTGFEFVDPLTAEYALRNQAKDALQLVEIIAENNNFSDTKSKSGLFAEATQYGGVFYRQFSQDVTSNDLELYFPADPILESGVCAGCCYNWLIHYLTNNELPYSNNNLKLAANSILEIQKELRFRDQPLEEFLLLSGLKPIDGLYNRELTFSNQEMLINSICNPGCGTISYDDPEQGRHVTAFFVDSNKNLFFSDVNKGDVFVPHPGSKEWLTKYCNIFLKSCEYLTVSGFKTSEYNQLQMKQAITSLKKELAQDFTS